jgi:hypothetical protein
MQAADARCPAGSIVILSESFSKIGDNPAAAGRGVWLAVRAACREQVAGLVWRRSWVPLKVIRPGCKDWLSIVKVVAE